MQVKALTIKMQESYQNDAGTYKGTVRVADENNAQEISPSAKSIARIFAIIKEGVAAQAMKVAVELPRAIDEVETQPLLIEHSHI